MSGLKLFRMTAFAVISGMALIIGIASIACGATDTSPTSPSPPAARDTSAEDRRKGFHCLDPWDGNHNGLEALIRDQLNDPGSMETIETGITPVDADGQHTVRLEFTAKNAFGGRVRNTAYGWVDQATCEATLGWIE